MSDPVSSAVAAANLARTPRKRSWVALAVLAAYVLAVAGGGLYTDHFLPLPDPTKPVNGWQWWFTPHEQNAFMRMPVITGELNGMDVSTDGRIIVLVGDEDFLLTSPDSGRTWIRGTLIAGESPPGSLTPSGAFNFNVGLTGKAYAYEPAPPKPQLDQQQKRAASLPQGSQPPAAAPGPSNAPSQSPEPMKGGPNPADSEAADKPTASEAKRPRAETKRGTTGTTRPPLDAKPQPEVSPPIAELDKAQSAVPPPRESKRKLLDVSIVDDNTFVAVGERGLIVRSTDAGRTWSIRSSGIVDSLRAIACAQKRCFAVGWPGAVVRTTDAGETWLSTGLDRAYDFNAIFSSSDGTWLAMDSLGRQCTLASDARVIAESDPKLVDGDARIVDVAFDRARTTGVLTTRSQRVLASRDSGRSWRPVATPIEGNVQAAGIDAAGRVVIMGGDPLRIYSTTDLGKYWSSVEQAAGRAPTRQDRPSRPRIKSTEQGQVFILAPNNTLLRGSVLRSSVDSPWRQLAFGGDDFRDLEMLSAQRGLVVGSRGLVLSTKDGGDTWEPRDSGVDSDLNSVSRADDRGALAVSDAADIVLSTHDAGDTWSEQKLPQSPGGAGEVALRAMELGDFVRFAGPDHIFAAKLPNVSESSDGGSSWRQRKDLPTMQELGFADARNGVLTGSLVRSDLVAAGKSSYGTTDAGQTWQKLDGAQAVWFKRNGRTRYALFAADGSTPFQFPGSLELPAKAFKVLRDARATAFNDDGVGIAIQNTRDALLRTRDNGVTWAPIANPTQAPLESICFAGNDRVVALAQGRIAISDNAGETFRSVVYRRHPSPWLWLASLLLVAGVLVYAHGSINAPAVEVGPASIADAAASDRPIQWWDPDHAGLRDIALGLSRFLRNRKTDPPLTIAVTGEWGTGKSSLMNLLRHDLERYGYKPVWFNAWHHQSGENLLGSLLANIHAQGVPAFFSLAGLDFRVSLTAIRGRRLWLQACLIVLVFAVVGFSYPVLKDKWFSFWTTLSKTGEGDFLNLKAATGVFGFALAVLWQLAGVVRMVSAFGLQPGKLISAVASTSEDESARNQAGALYRFAREFEDFTRALEPRPLVVFIDDLDRCRAPNVVETLEAVNFLVSSGRCIVVLGMARHWVETCVGLAFKELADAHVEAAQVTVAAGSSEQRLFARHYLEKLINIEIRVPQLSEAAASAILQGGEPSAPHHDMRYAFGTFLLRLGRWSSVLLALGAIAWLGHWIAQSFTSTTEPRVAEVKAAEPTSARAATPESPTLTPAAAAPVERTTTPIEVARVEPSRELTSTAWYWSGGALAMLATLALAMLALLARLEARTDDSPAFREALRIWQPFILLGGTSPRSLKRFINQLRYLAMRSRLSPDTTTAYERITKRIRGFFGRNTPEVPSLAPPRHDQLLTEELLVALAALHRCDETWLRVVSESAMRVEPNLLRREGLETFLQQALAERLRDAEERSAVVERLVAAAAEFNRVFSTSALFVDPMLDHSRALAFFELMALDEVPPTPPGTGIAPAPPRVETAATDQIF